MATTFQIQLTDALLDWMGKNKVNSSEIGVYLQNIQGATNKLVDNQWQPLSSLSKISNSLYQFSAISGNAARIYVGVPTASPIPMGMVIDQQTNSGPGYLYAYGETNFGADGSTNMDTSIIDSFGLPYSIQAINGKGNPSGPIQSTGVGLTNKPYSYAYWSASSTKGNLGVFNNKNTGGIVPPAFSDKGYHDFSDYYQSLSRLTKSKDYAAWLKRGDTKWFDKGVTTNNQSFDGKAAFFNFNGKSGDSGSGYILIGGDVAGASIPSKSTSYSVLMPWGLDDLTALGLSGLASDYQDALKYNKNRQPGDKPHPVGNLLSEQPYIYQNDITGFYVNDANIFENSKGEAVRPSQIDKSRIKSVFKGAEVYDISSQGDTWNAPSTPQMAQFVGDLIYGLNKGLVGSPVDFVTGFGSKDLPYKGVNPTMNIGDLPSEAWYTTDVVTGSMSSAASAAWLGKNGPVKSGVWGGWAWPNLAAKGTKDFWNNYSFMLNGKLPVNQSQYGSDNGLSKARPPLLPDTYSWAMDDRSGGQLLSYSSGLRMTFDTPQFTASTNPINPNM